MSEARPKYELLVVDGGAAEVQDAQRLRYKVFVEELGGCGDGVRHDDKLETDQFDPFFDHLILYDRNRNGDQAVGAYRVMREDQARKAGRFYTEAEYDLTPLKTSGRTLLELGRSCVHPEYRGGAALAQLWVGLLNYTSEHKIGVMFGVASFHGTDLGPLREPVANLHHNHLAPQNLRTRVLEKHYHTADLMPADMIDEKAAMKATPALIKAYIRLGGVIGDGVFVDHPFNTTDVCIIVDLEKVPARQRAIYEKLAAREGSA